jgi:ATP-dependent DNA helicase RecG
MVPTELLAEQHAASIARLLEPVGLRSALLTGSMRRGAREPVLRGLVSGSIDVLVGTHALIQEGVELRALGLVVVDEQHRFGVRQRLSLRQKGREPHVLVMTATPIPRSLSLTVYGDLDVSVLDERPPGRGSVTTTVVAESHRDQVYSAARAQLDEGRQAFFVYPLVEEAEDGALRAATEMATHLAEGPMAGLRVGLIHGGLPPAEKDAVMAAFVAGDLQVLVATTVIEVGIDVPNATIMVVEHAERFGLSQLHQLRGRIGRGDQGHPSTCFLIAADSTTADARRRLAVLARTDDGFEIAEADLRQRGPGEFLGTRQSGLPRFDVADLVRDVSILGEARRAAFDLVDSDPALAGHPLVRDAVRERWAGNLELLEVG